MYVSTQVIVFEKLPLGLTSGVVRNVEEVRWTRPAEQVSDTEVVASGLLRAVGESAKPGGARAQASSAGDQKRPPS